MVTPAVPPLQRCHSPPGCSMYATAVPVSGLKENRSGPEPDGFVVGGTVTNVAACALAGATRAGSANNAANTAVSAGNFKRVSGTHRHASVGDKTGVLSVRPAEDGAQLWHGPDGATTRRTGRECVQSA